MQVYFSLCFNFELVVYHRNSQRIPKFLTCGCSFLQELKKKKGDNVEDGKLKLTKKQQEMLEEQMRTEREIRQRLRNVCLPYCSSKKFIKSAAMLNFRYHFILFIIFFIRLFVNSSRFRWDLFALIPFYSIIFY